jgi:hypothetical protein
MVTFGRSLALLLVASFPCGAGYPAEPAPVPPPAQEQSPPLPEVIVSTPEPRYVAPTLRDRIGRIWAPVYLNGQGPFRLVLDTGANRSAVIQRVADSLGEAARTTSTVRVRGVTGTAVVPVVRVDRMDIGDLVLEPAYLPVVQDVFGGADGVLGNEGLRDKRIVIDFRNDSITVRRSKGEQPGAGFETLPLAMMRNYLLVIDVVIGRVPAKAVIDTGAPDSLGNLALLEALKKQGSEDPDTDIVGVTLDVEQGSRVRTPTVYMGGVQIRGAVLTFSDVYIFEHWRLTKEPAMMVGMDVLGVLDQLIIDYKSRRMHMRTSRR